LKQVCRADKIIGGAEKPSGFENEIMDLNIEFQQQEYITRIALLTGEY
jgi:hypothetical protein